MSHYDVHNTASGSFIGTYHGNGADDALDAMSRDAGCRSFSQSSTARDTDEAADRAEMDVRPVKKFIDSMAGQAFVRTAASRETSDEIMEAIAFFANNEAEAVNLWNGDGFGVVCHPSDLWERVTGNGRVEADKFSWGAAGENWWPAISVGS